MCMSKNISNFADRLFFGVHLEPRGWCVLIVERLATPMVSESAPKQMFFSSNKNFLKVKNGHFKLQDNLR